MCAIDDALMIDVSYLDGVGLRCSEVLAAIPLGVFMHPIAFAVQP
jgi:hypothetical protein